MEVARHLRQFRVWLAVIVCFVLPGSVSGVRVISDPAVTHANNIRTGSIAYKEAYFGSGDNRLHYVEAGHGPLIILYHGFPSFWYSWFDQMEMLKTRYRVVAVDGLGGGMSAKPKQVGAYKVARLAAQIDQLARHLDGEERFILMGHDWGAALAFAYAQAYPKRLSAVIGLSAPPYNQFLDLVRNNPTQQARSGYMQAFKKITRESLAASGTAERIWQQSYSSLIAAGSLSVAEGNLFRRVLTDPETMNGGMNWYRANVPKFSMVSKTDYWPCSNPKIAVPALLVWGNADTTFVDEFVTKLPSYASDINIIRLAGVGHWTTMEKPTLTNTAIEAFLRTKVAYRSTSSSKSH